MRVCFFCVAQIVAQCLFYMNTEQCKNFVLVFATHHSGEYIVLLFALFFLSVAYVAAYKQEYSDGNECEHTHKACVEHNYGYEGTDNECHECGDKPSANYRKHTCYAVNRTFASPCTVGQ